MVLPLGPSGSLTVGPTLNYANTELEPGRFITAAQPYGVGKFGQIGAKATAEVARAAGLTLLRRRAGPAGALRRSSGAAETTERYRNLVE